MSYLMSSDPEVQAIIDATSDHSEAKRIVKYTLLSARGGSAKGQFEMGLLYENGTIGHYLFSDYDKAAEWYQKAALQGHARAQHYLGSLYWQGRGVAQSDKLAFEWTQKSALQNDYSALMDLGEMYEHGQGIEQDINKACECYLKASIFAKDQGGRHIRQQKKLEALKKKLEMEGKSNGELKTQTEAQITLGVFPELCQF